MFILLTNIMCNTMFGTLQIFQFERPVFLREQANRMYSFVPYFLTKNLHEQPLIVAQPLLTLTMMFWAVGYYPSAQTFFGMYLALYMFSQCGVSLGFFISTISPDMQVGIAIAMPILLLFVLFGGFAVNTSTLPGSIRWMQWLSPFRYAYEAMCISEFEPRGMQDYYEDFLGFNQGYWKCIVCMAVWMMILRTISLFTLKMSIVKVQ